MPAGRDDTPSEALHQGPAQLVGAIRTDEQDQHTSATLGRVSDLYVVDVDVELGRQRRHEGELARLVGHADPQLADLVGRRDVGRKVEPCDSGIGEHGAQRRSVAGVDDPPHPAETR